MSEPVILAVDGGNSKTDLALVGVDGRLIALTRGPGSSPHQIGAEGCVSVIAELLQSARERSGLELERAAAGVILVAGADLESEELELRELVLRRNWAERLEIGNDTLAVLRAGSDRGYGVAVVCGAGINAIGLAPDGRRTRFPALGPITGDWGGGGDLGLGALGSAVRADDGRGQQTVLARLVPEHFSLPSARDVAVAIHRRELERGRLVELAPLVLRAAEDGDAGALELRERLVQEVVAFVRAAGSEVLTGVERYDVVLGGSLLTRSASLAELVAQRIRATLPAADPRACTVLPVAGSALIGIEMLASGDGAPAAAAVRAALQAPLDREGDERLDQSRGAA